MAKRVSLIGCHWVIEDRRHSLMFTGSAEFRCSLTFPHGHVVGSCSELSEFCSFRCDPGYYSSVNKGLCDVFGEWNFVGHAGDIYDLCKPILCPLVGIPNGYLSDDCSRRIGSTCGYRCQTGYSHRETGSTNGSLICGASFTWDDDPYALCTKVPAAETTDETGNGDTAIILASVGATIFFLLVAAIAICSAWCRSGRQYPPNPAYRRRLHAYHRPESMVQTPGSREMDQNMSEQHGSRASLNPSVHVHQTVTNYETTSSRERSETGHTGTHDLPPSYDEVITHPSAYKS